MDPTANPFAVLSLIVAPAILTNAASVLVMSTSTRLARAADRARQLSKELETGGTLSSPEADQPLSELAATERRVLLLLRGLRSFYASLGGFASATLVSLIGAVLVPFANVWVVRSVEIAGVVAGLLAVGSIVHGSALLLQETRIAVQVLSDRAASLRERTGK